MEDVDVTCEETRSGGRERLAALPGIVRVFSRGEPACDARPVASSLVVGRATDGGFDVPDDRLSRRHFRLNANPSGAPGFVVIDERSRNGTWVDGAQAERREAWTGSVVRAGRSVFLLVDDVRRFVGTSLAAPGGETVCGPTLATALRRIEERAVRGRTLSLHGESGSGKELAAQAFHDAAGGGPFVAVNCAAIPEGMAERLLFGTKRGAYSGAQADAEGWIGAAHGGTLFLDEVAELDLRIQAKLLRVLERGELTPLGAAHPTAVRFRLCVATHKDLRDEAAQGRFRKDLFYRIGVDAVRLPALRERREDIPVFVVREVRRAADTLEVDARFIEECMRRAWPGNVRELIAEVRVAVGDAIAAGRTVLDDGDLAPGAGRAIGDAGRGPSTEELAAQAVPSEARGMPSDETIARHLRESDGNVTRAARELGIHRNQLRRWLARQAEARAVMEPQDAGSPSDPEPEP